MQIVSLDDLSYTAFPIKIYDGIGNELAVATGFYYQVGDILWLITNWHNVTGFDPDTNKRLPDVNASPEKIAVPIMLKTNGKGIEWKWYIVNLYENKRPRWLVHPTYKSKVDVIAIKIGGQIPENLIKPVNKIAWDSDIKPRVADNVYVLGFPYGLRGGGNFPLWKRATIASEPDIYYDNLPQFMIDTTTRKGMSGSPVILRRVGIHGIVNGLMGGESTIGEVQNFIGVYSGRFYASEREETQLGKVWKGEVIKDIINSNVKDNQNYLDNAE